MTLLKGCDLLQLDNILFNIVTIHLFDQICLWISRVYTIKMMSTFRNKIYLRSHVAICVHFLLLLSA